MEQQKTTPSDRLAVKFLCPYCKSSLEGESTVRCESCDTAHHTLCWKEHDSRCAVFRCPGSGTVIRLKTAQFLRYALLGLFVVSVLLAGGLIYQLNQQKALTRENEKIRQELAVAKGELAAQQHQVIELKANSASYDHAIRVQQQLQVLDNHKNTMSSIRQIATAVESYAVDNSRYPPEPREKYLVPIYARVLPKADAWGNAFKYSYSSEKYPHYSITSPGQDRKYGTKDDYLFSDGQWELAPKPSDLQLEPLDLPGGDRIQADGPVQPTYTSGMKDPTN